MDGHVLSYACESTSFHLQLWFLRSGHGLVALAVLGRWHPSLRWLAVDLREGESESGAVVGRGVASGRWQPMDTASLPFFEDWFPLESSSEAAWNSGALSVWAPSMGKYCAELKTAITSSHHPN